MRKVLNYFSGFLVGCGLIFGGYDALADNNVFPLEKGKSSYSLSLSKKKGEM